MFVKYIVKRENASVVVKFDLRSNRVVIGGYVKFIDFIGCLISETYFDIDSPNCHSQRNKVRYEKVMLSLKHFNDIMIKVQEDFYVTKAKRVERLL